MKGAGKVKLVSRLKALPGDISWSLGLNRSHFTNARGARILVYHGVCRDDHLRFNTLFVTQKMFEAQLRFYKKYFTIISLDDFYHQNFSNERFNICLSFDDGFANNYKYVLPLLEKYQVPATFFITGISDAGYDILWNDVLSIAYKYGPEKFRFGNEDFIKGKDGKYISSSTGKGLVHILRSVGFEAKAEMIALLGKFKKEAGDDYWLQMTTQEIKKMSDSKWVTIGNHSYYHNDLATIPVKALKDDLTRSKQFLETITGKEIKALAFPYGSYTPEVVSEAKQAGFKQLLATDFLFPADSHDATLKERLTINPFISNINQAHASITGNY